MLCMLAKDSNLSSGIAVEQSAFLLGEKIININSEYSTINIHQKIFFHD